MTAPTVFEAKPPYHIFFGLVAGLPAEMKAITCHLLLWIWKHTNSDVNHQNYGKAWMSQANVAREMHLCVRAVQNAFNDAFARGLINREHLFRKNGKVIVSTLEYTKSTCKGRGEYLHSRYWINWDVLRGLQVVGAAENTTPIPSEDENGVAENATPTENGVADFTTPTENGIAESATPVADFATPVADFATKGLTYGLTEGLSLPPQAIRATQPQAQSGEKSGEVSNPAWPPTPNFEQDGWQEGRRGESEINPDFPRAESTKPVDLSRVKSRLKRRATSTAPQEPELTLSDLVTVWKAVRVQLGEDDSDMIKGMPHPGWSSLQDELRKRNMLSQIEEVKSAYQDYLKDYYVPAIGGALNIDSPLAVFRGHLDDYMAVKS